MFLKPGAQTVLGKGHRTRQGLLWKVVGGAKQPYSLLLKAEFISL